MNDMTAILGAAARVHPADAEVEAAMRAAAEHDGFNPDGLTLDGPERARTHKMLAAAASVRRAANYPINYEQENDS